MTSTRFWKSGECKVGTLLLVTALAISVGLASCDDEGTTGPEQEEDDATNVDATDLFPGLTVSDPTGPPSSGGALAGGGALAAASLGLTYVSACAGTFPDVETITITNLENGESQSVDVEDGGFDPVALEAEPDDTLEIQVRRNDGSSSTYFTLVPTRKRPRVVRTLPRKDATDVVLSVRPIVVFSEPVDGGTVTVDNLQLQLDGEPVDGTLELHDDGLRAEFTPAEQLQLGTTYTLVITAGVLDLQGDAVEEEVQATFTTASRIVSLSAGAYHTCAVGADGAAFCWGANWYGQLGSPSSNLEPPRRVSTGLGFTSLSLGLLHTCGVTVGEQAYCWGYNLTGELGNGTTTHRDFPSPVSGEYSFVSVTAGAAYACGLTADSTAYCWGSNDSHELGTSSRLETCIDENGWSHSCWPTPRPVGSYVFLTVGYSVTCGIAPDGATYCWGDNINGQLGVEEAPETCSLEYGQQWPCSSLPQLVTGGHSFVFLTAGVTQTCGLTAEGTAYCWGNNFTGQLGAGFVSGPFDLQYTPLEVVGGHSFVSLVAGSEHTCGLTADGQAFCWGLNSDGQLGIGEVSDKVPQPVAVTGSHTFEALTTWWYFTCGLTTDGDVYCWGNNNEGQLGVPPESQPESATPIRVPLQP